MVAPSARLETGSLARNSVSRRLAPFLFLLALLLLGYWLRVHALDAFSFWTDEGLSPERSGYPITQILRNEIVIQGVVTKDTHPPLYYLILHVTRQLFGLSDFAFRYPSVLFGVLLIPLIYRLGRRMAGLTLGLIVALLATVNPLHVYYSQEARMYTLLVLLVTAMSYVLWRALISDLRRKSLTQRRKDAGRRILSGASFASLREHPLLRWIVLYGFLAALALYTHYTVAFLIAAQAVFWAWLLWRAGLRWVIVGAVAAGVVAAIPLVPYTLPRLMAGAEANYYPVSPLTVLADVVRFFHLGLTVDFEQPFIVWLNWLVFGLLVLGVWAAGLRIVGAGLRPAPTGNTGGAWRARLFLLSWLLAVPLGLMIGSALFKPMYQGVRHIMAGSPAFLLLAGYGIWALLSAGIQRKDARTQGRKEERRHWVLASWRFCAFTFTLLLLLGAAVALTNLYNDPAYVKDDFRAIVRFIETRAGGRDAVIYNNAVLLPLHEHYRLRQDLTVTALPAYPQFATGQEPELAALAAAYDRLWFVTDPPADGRDAGGLIHARLDDTLLEVSDRTFPARTTEARVVGFATTAADQPPTAANAPAAVGGRSPAIGFRIDRSPLSLPTLWVDLWWGGEKPAAEDKIVFSLAGPDGAEHYARAHALLRDIDFNWNPDAPNRLSYDLPLPPGLPPGTYALAVGPEGETPAALGEVIIEPTTTWPASPQDLFAQTDLAAVGRRASAVWPGLELAAVEPWDDSVIAGNNLPLTLFWRVAPEGIDLTNVRYRLEVIDRAGAVLRSQETRPGAPWLGQMAGGALLREVTSLYFRPETPPGRYRLRWTLLDGEMAVGRQVIAGEVVVEPLEVTS